MMGMASARGLVDAGGLAGAGWTPGEDRALRVSARLSFDGGDELGNGEGSILLSLWGSLSGTALPAPILGA